MSNELNEGKLFKPELLFISCTGNHVYSEDLAIVAERTKRIEEMEAKRRALVESARKKLTEDEFDAVVQEGDYY